jgi:hypothetical protein
VYLEVGKYFPTARNTEEIAQQLKEEYSSLSRSRLSREFVRKAIKLLSRVILPEMVRHIPKDGNWTLMIDGTERASNDDVLIIIAAVPLDGSHPPIIPLVAKFLPSENTRDIMKLFHELKPLLPSLPRSIISDFRVGLLEAIGEVFPNSIKQGCHYHILEMIARTMIHPLISQINRKIGKAVSGLNRWAHHSIYGRKTDNLVLVAKSLQKLCQSTHGKFGHNFLQFCKKLQDLSSWVQKNAKYLKSDPNYADLVKFLDDKLWRPLAPHLSQLTFVMKEFARLRRYLTIQEYKTQIVDTEPASTGSTVAFDQLIQDWIKVGEMNKNSQFHQRFKKSATRLKTYRELLIPAILDNELPRTTSALENLYGRIKHFLRKWSGTMKLRRTFQWAAPLAAVCRSLEGTGLFQQILDQQTGYDWVEHTLELATVESQRRKETRFANLTASKTPSGLVSVMANLISRDLA